MNVNRIKVFTVHTWHMKLKAFDTVQLKVDKGILYAYCANRIEFSGTLIKQIRK